MNISFVICVYPPEGEPSAVMAEELARSWVRSGNDVTVVCPFPNRPHGVVHPGFRRTWRSIKNIHGVRVVRVWTWLIGRRRLHINRIMENISFGISAALTLLFSKRPDVIVLASWPILSRLPILLVSYLRRVSIINYVKDLYPEAMSSAGMLKASSPLYRLLVRLDSFICRHVKHTVVISDSVREVVAETRKLDPSHLSVIRDFLNLDAIRPFPGRSRWREEVGISRDDMVFMYAGTMGLASRVDVLTEVARLTASANDVRIVCIGEGVLKDGMLQEKAAQDLTNLLIFPFQPRERVSEVQSSADVMLMLTARNMGVSSVPSKLITYLAVGKPVLAAAEEDSDLARLIRDNGLGLVVEPENPESIAEAMLSLRSLGRTALADMGMRARRYAEAHYSVERAVSQFQTLLFPGENRPAVTAEGADNSLIENRSETPILSTMQNKAQQVNEREISK